MRPTSLLPVALLALASCSSEPAAPDPVGRWEFVVDATVEANRSVIIGEFGEQGPAALETALGLLEQSFEGAEMHFELAEDGTLTGHRSQPVISTGQTYERDENGSWARTAPESGELVLTIVDPNDDAYSIERAATVAGDRLEVETRQGTATMTFVFERVR